MPAAGIARTDHDHVAREGARDAAQQHAGAAVLGLEEVGADLDREPAGDLGHRF